MLAFKMKFLPREEDDLFQTEELKKTSSSSSEEVSKTETGKQADTPACCVVIPQKINIYK